jgi:hypothetical protein
MRWRATICYAGISSRTEDNALWIKERDSSRSRCETGASWTSIARVCPSVRQDSPLFALFFERYMPARLS